MRRLVLTSLFAAAAVFAQSGAAPAPQSSQSQPAAPKATTKSATKSAKKHKKSNKQATPAAATKTSQSK